MIEITPNIRIDEKEIHFDFIRASGPGGQNVNKVASAVQLRFDVKSTSSIPEDVRQRLIDLSGKRMTSDGILILKAQRFRTQERNRKNALDRFIQLVQKASVSPKHRRATKPTFASRERRIESKKKRSGIKKDRQKVRRSDLE